MLRDRDGGQNLTDSYCDSAPTAGSGETPAGALIGGGDASGGEVHKLADHHNRLDLSANTEIGVAAKPVRRRRATCSLNTTSAMPAVENFGAGATRKVVTMDRLPPSPIPSGGQSGYEPPSAIAASETGAATPLSHTINTLIELQKQRAFCIKSQSRCDRSCEAFIARFLGFEAPKEKDKDKSGQEARKALFAKAAAMRKAIEKGGNAPADGGGHCQHDNHVLIAVSVCTPIVVNSALSRSAWDGLRTDVEKKMVKLARTLPVYRWAKDVKGLGDKSLAIIIGETGDLSGYATQERVWKRLGLAVIDGERQQRRTNGDQAAAHGYNPRRRAEIWAIADSMFKHQWCGDKDADGKNPALTKEPVAVPAHASGPYGEVYAARKEHTRGRNDWSAKRRDNDARRIMTKALIADLWMAWRNAV